MKTTELRSQDMKALQKLLAEKRAAAQKLVLELNAKEVKDVRSLRRLKKEIARILTVGREQELETEGGSK